jgi:phage head maturation protease
VKADKWSKDAEGRPLRRLLDVELDGGDVAIVTGPAYPQTTVEVRDMAAALSGAGSAPIEQQSVDAASTEARLDLLKRKLELEKLK